MHLLEAADPDRLAAAARGQLRLDQAGIKGGDHETLLPEKEQILARSAARFQQMGACRQLFQKALTG